MNDTASNLPRWHIPPWSWALLVSALAWAILIIAIPPTRQNFPLSDDWAFARGAIWFAHGQGIHYSKWASLPQLGQWLWSVPFLLVSHLPHFALRLSVITLSWLGLAAFYDLLRQEKIPARLAGLAACVFATNPLFFVAQGTYMTDVPALSFGLLALNAYSHAIHQKNLRWLFGAIMLAVLAVITRQTMIVVPLVAGLMLLRFPEIRLKPFWWLAIVVPVVVCLAVNHWFAHRPDITPMQLTLRVKALLFRPFLALHWCGLAVLPLCWLAAPRRNWKIFLSALIFMLACAGCVFHWGTTLPYGGLFPYCAGMLSPWGTYSDGLMAGDRAVLLTPLLRMAISILGCLGGAAILAAMVESFRARKLPGFLPLFTFFQFLLMLTIPPTMDRYLAVLFPGALYLMVTRCADADSNWLPKALVVALCGLISVALLHDWFAWNTARWELGRQAVATRNISPTDIEGGFEWDGWYVSADPNRPGAVPESNHSLNDQPGLKLLLSRHYFPQVRGKFALTFSRLENSVVIASQPYTLWLPWAQKDFLLVQYQGEQGEKPPE